GPAGRALAGRPDQRELLLGLEAARLAVRAQHEATREVGPPVELEVRLESGEVQGAVLAERRHERREDAAQGEGRDDAPQACGVFFARAAVSRSTSFTS